MSKKFILFSTCFVSGIFAMEETLKGAYSTKLNKMAIAEKASLSIIREYDERTEDLLVSKRPGVYVPGLGELSARQEMEKYKRGYTEKKSPSLLYPDNLVVYDAPDQGPTIWCRINKGTSFGKTEGNELVKKLHTVVNTYGVKELTLFPICRGATSTVYALNTLLHNSEPENRQTIHNLKMSPTDCKTILHAIKSMPLQCPMQKVDDSVDIITNKTVYGVTKVIQTALPLCNFAKNCPEIQSIADPFSENALARLGSYITLKGFLPLWSSYSPTQQKPVELLANLQGLKNENPNLKILMTAKDKDEFIGSDPAKIENYYNQLPVLDSNKYLLASPATSTRADINHVTLHDNIKFGWHSFLKRSGSSYYLLPTLLQQGDQILDNAREQQRELGIQKFLINAYKDQN